MASNDVWVIHHKATLSEDSPLNMDGSEWVEGICIIPASDKNSALSGFRQYLSKNLMQEIEVYEIKVNQPDDFADHENAKHITHGVRVATDKGEVAYIGLMTSEGLADSEDDDDE